jgi:hypothetical protein
VWLFEEGEGHATEQRSVVSSGRRHLRDARPRARHAPDEPLVRKRLAEYPEFLRALFWSDGMVRVSGREYNGLVESPCYVACDRAESHDVVLLVSHDAHDADDPRPGPQWAATHQVAAGKAANEACLQCHPKFREN